MPTAGSGCNALIPHRFAVAATRCSHGCEPGTSLPPTPTTYPRHQDSGCCGSARHLTATSSMPLC
eukprot:scaffold1194_cov369-Prasinococcus_capsulatus_cf.AAC.18